MAEYGINGTTLNLDHLQLKFKNAAKWGVKEVPPAGEVGVELDTHKAKIGDGQTAWGSLPYSTDPTVAELASTLSRKITARGTRLDTVEGQVSTLETTSQDHETRISTAEGTIPSQGAHHTTAEGTLSSHGTRFAADEGNIDTLEGNMTTAKDNITSESRTTTIDAKDTAQGGA